MKFVFHFQLDIAKQIDKQLKSEWSIIYGQLFTMVAAILFNQTKANFLIIPGFVVSLLGICWVLGGEQGFDLIGMANNIQQNPLSYGLAFLGTLLWAAYCTLTHESLREQMELLYSLFWFRSCFGLKYLVMGGDGFIFDWLPSLFPWFLLLLRWASAMQLGMLEFCMVM